MPTWFKKYLEGLDKEEAVELNEWLENNIDDVADEMGSVLPLPEEEEEEN
jgi:hypothetical protein